MTNEEALNDCKRIREDIKSDIYLEYYNNTEELQKYHLDVIDMVIAALEKRIPQKPITNDVGGQLELICPGCEHDYVARNGRIYSFCPSCGQEIDWSDKDE